MARATWRAGWIQPPSRDARQRDREWPLRLSGSEKTKRKEHKMSVSDKAKNKTQAEKGKLKETAGKATNDRSLEAKGKTDRVSGNLKQAGQKVKDAVKK